MSDPSVIAVLLGFPTFVFLVVVCAASPLRRLGEWLIRDAGGWGQ